MYPQLFSRYPNRHTKGWLKYLPDDERKVFGKLGYLALMESYGFETATQVFHYAGGRKRSSIAKRDKRGRFKRSKSMTR